MLITRRSEGDWIDLIHKASGDVVRIRTYNCEPGRVVLAFDDSALNFEISRPERGGALRTRKPAKRLEVG